jgi:hypothetical protein
MAEAFSDPPRSTYKYQYSVLPALHGFDVSGFFGPAAEWQGPDLVMAMMNIVGNFVTTNNPSISASLAAGASASSTNASNPITDWPQFDVYNPVQISLNQTGGTASSENFIGETNSTIYVGNSLQNDFSLHNAWTWEAGRGYRCDMWKSLGIVTPA